MKRYFLPSLALLLMVIYFLPYFIGGSKGPLHLVSINKKAVKKLVIKRDGEEIEIKKQDKHWQIVRPISWSADDTRVERILDGLEETILETPVTSKKGDYEKYNIKDDGDFIELSDGKNTERVYLGKRGARYQLMYVRPASDKRVYLVQARFADWLPENVNKIRDRTIVKIAPESITQVFWKDERESYSIVKKGDSWFGGSKAGKETQRLDAKKVKDYLEQFRSLEGSGFLINDKLPEKAKKTGMLKIIASRQYTLELYKNEKDSSYFLVKDAVPYRISSYFKDRIFKKP